MNYSISINRRESFPGKILSFFFFYQIIQKICSTIFHFPTLHNPWHEHHQGPRTKCATNVTAPSWKENKLSSIEAYCLNWECQRIPKYTLSFDCSKMRPTGVLLAACLLKNSGSQPVKSDLQAPLLEDLASTHPKSTASQHLHGRFLHITGGEILILSLMRS